MWRAIRSADVSYHYPNSCKVTFSPAAHAIDFGQEAGMPAGLSVIAAAGGAKRGAKRASDTGLCSLARRHGHVAGRGKRVICRCGGYVRGVKQ